MLNELLKIHSHSNLLITQLPYLFNISHVRRKSNAIIGSRYSYRVDVCVCVCV